MANTDYKSPDALMRHLRDNGISISQEVHKNNSSSIPDIFTDIKDTVFLYLPLTDFHSLHIMRLTQPFNMIQN